MASSSEAASDRMSTATLPSPTAGASAGQTGTSKPYCAVIVGAGLSGAVMAERIATVLEQPVLVIDKRDHIGGNVYDYIEPETGLRISKYGAHLFHTEDEGVWDYVTKFGKWRRWDHKVLSLVQGNYVPIPANITTVNTLFGTNIKNPEEMRVWMEKERMGYSEETATNSKEVALARVGPRLYDLMIKEYTFKQWAKYPEALDPLVLKRIPVRDNFDERYFGDRFQALPEEGYTTIVRNILANPLIHVKLEADYFADRSTYDSMADWVVYTGPIDRFFAGEGLPALEYRSINFHTTVVKGCKGYAQPASVVNYPEATPEATRTVEYKHFLHQSSDDTILVSETTSADGEPYYPVPTERNRALHAKYQALAEAYEKESRLPRTIFVGRLATYKYINMDQAVRLALDAFGKYFK